jgi:alkanesulfonate monooxygenase SsuD/methylene tetrahydromethanopterin reductase-like flavin-dependent oxidoreductase (luciferase family)
VIIQAGQSGRGKTFAARWGEVVFTTYQSIASGKDQYRSLRDEIARSGRNPEAVTIAPAVYTVVAETRAMAEDKVAVIDATALPIDGFTLLSEVVNFDFAKKPADEAFSDAELAAMGGMQALRDRVVQASGKRNPTPRDFVDLSRRGTIRENPQFIGSAADVADQMEEWYSSAACDGFVLCATHVPGGYEDFVRLVVPELQRRGLFRKEYAGSTLRDNLGLARP